MVRSKFSSQSMAIRVETFHAAQSIDRLISEMCKIFEEISGGYVFNRMSPTFVESFA